MFVTGAKAGPQAGAGDSVWVSLMGGRQEPSYLIHHLCFSASLIGSWKKELKAGITPRNCDLRGRCLIAGLDAELSIFVLHSLCFYF